MDEEGCEGGQDKREGIVITSLKNDVYFHYDDGGDKHNEDDKHQECEI